MIQLLIILYFVVIIWSFVFLTKRLIPPYYGSQERGLAVFFCLIISLVWPVTFTTYLIDTGFYLVIKWWGDRRTKEQMYRRPSEFEQDEDY